MATTVQATPHQQETLPTQPAPQQQAVADPALDSILSRTKAQLTREDFLLAHLRKTSISRITGERACLTRPVKHGAGTPGVRVRHYKTGRSSAYISSLQRSKSFTCPVSHINKVMRQREENSWLATQHAETGGSFIAGTFTMKTGSAPTPRFFYSRNEKFRNDNKDADGTLHDLKQEGFEQFLTDNPAANSWDGWDLNRRLDAANEGIRRIFDGGSGWQRNKNTYKLAGRILSIEVVITPTWEQTTTGAWVPDYKRVKHNLHIHFLLFSDLTPDELAQADLTKLTTSFHGRWQKGLNNHGFTSTLKAQQLVPVGVTPGDVRRQASYLSKPMTVETATETVAAGTTDDSDNPFGSVSFADILRDATAGRFDSRGELHPASEEAKLWWQNFEGACYGRHFHRTSPTLSTRYGLKQFREDTAKEYKAKVAEVEDCCFFDREVWNSLIKSNPSVRTELLNLAENGGGDAVRDYLTDAGIPFRLPGDPASFSPTDADARAARQEQAA